MESPVLGPMPANQDLMVNLIVVSASPEYRFDISDIFVQGCHKTSTTTTTKNTVPAECKKMKHNEAMNDFIKNHSVL